MLTAVERSSTAPTWMGCSTKGPPRPAARRHGQRVAREARLAHIDAHRRDLSVGAEDELGAEQPGASLYGELALDRRKPG